MSDVVDTSHENDSTNSENLSDQPSSSSLNRDSDNDRDVPASAVVSRYPSRNRRAPSFYQAVFS